MPGNVDNPASLNNKDSYVSAIVKSLKRSLKIDCSASGAISCVIKGLFKMFKASVYSFADKFI